MTATPSTETPQTTHWTIDPAHSSVTFTVRHMMVTNVRGEFGRVSGTVHYDPKSPSSTKVHAVIETSSINTREPQRDGHLKSADFLDAEKYPTIEFVSTAARPKGKDEFEVDGDLTIHGVARKVTLQVEGLSHGGKDPFGKVRMGATARTTINRSEFGIKWNAAVEAGGVLVSDAVKVELDVSLVA